VCRASPLENWGSLAAAGAVFSVPEATWYRALPEALYGQVGSEANRSMMKRISRIATMTQLVDLGG
jgi:hypothetical protein